MFALFAEGDETSVVRDNHLTLAILVKPKSYCGNTTDECNFKSKFLSVQ